MTVPDFSVVLVAAIGENGVIGRNGELPWRMKSDLQHFRRVTIGKPVIMGRKTYQSIRRPLKDRTNIVVTRDASCTADGIVVAHGMDEAYALARADAAQRGTRDIMVIGGNELFTLAMTIADRLEITRVHMSPEGDVTFPPIDPALWRETVRQHHARGPEDDTDFTTLTYERIR